MIDHEYYEVRQILSGRLVYYGPRLVAAASALDPGTCYGIGNTPVGRVLRANRGRFWEK